MRPGWFHRHFGTLVYPCHGVFLLPGLSMQTVSCFSNHVSLCYQEGVSAEVSRRASDCISPPLGVKTRTEGDILSSRRVCVCVCGNSCGRISCPEQETRWRRMERSEQCSESQLPPRSRWEGLVNQRGETWTENIPGSPLEWYSQILLPQGLYSMSIIMTAWCEPVYCDI